jgi:hypothetical protein
MEPVGGSLLLAGRACGLDEAIADAELVALIDGAQQA